MTLRRRHTMTERSYKLRAEWLRGCSPYAFSPLFYLTTGKAGWILGLPIALSFLAPRALAFWQTRRWLRELFAPERYPYHALLFCEALSWSLYRYLVTGHRIAHIPTLF